MAGHVQKKYNAQNNIKQMGRKRKAFGKTSSIASRTISEE